MRTKTQLSDLSTSKFNIEMALTRVRNVMKNTTSDHDAAHALTGIIATLETAVTYARYAQRDILAGIFEANEELVNEQEATENE
jgi:hypothetical protein